jgi:hypothetical protein
MMDATDREVFKTSLLHAVEGRTGSSLDDALREIGWHDALTLDSESAISLLFELQGSANVSSSALCDVLEFTLGFEGTRERTIVLPSLGRWEPPGRLGQGSLSVRGLGVTAMLDRPRTLVVASEGDTYVVLDVTTSDLVLRPVRGVDPGLGLVEVSGDRVPFDSLTYIEGTEWSKAVAVSQLALGHELVGTARTMLELAREHALARIQFGQPISAFQAVRHRLADTLVGIETAEAMLRSAWMDQNPESAGMAKALAGRGSRAAARHCQQVLAGIGFTTEHALHHYVRRVLVLDQLFGTATALTSELGNQLLRSRQLMALPLL